MFLADTWDDYEVLDTGNGEKLERWGSVILQRPDPQTIWPRYRPELWGKAQAVYHRSERGGGDWEFRRTLPEKWTVSHKELQFYVRPTGFKHTGLFPEQAANWLWMQRLIQESHRHDLRILNLFGYTGGATLACVSAGAHVTHVDAAKGMVQWAKENALLNHLPESSFRWIVEDALRFVEREIRRGHVYDGIIMDPPSYGRGPGGEVWKLENELYGLVSSAAQLLSKQALFFLINSYTTGFQASVLENLLTRLILPVHGGVAFSEELCLPVTSGGVLPCGASGRWQHG